MKHLIGMQSNAYTSDNEFRIDFARYKKYGVESIDFQGFIQGSSGFYSLGDKDLIVFFTRLKKELDKYGLIVNQLHAIWDPDYEFNHQELEPDFYYRKAILAASILKTRYVVMHPVPVKGTYLWHSDSYQDLYKTNIEFIKKLLPLLREKNVYLAIENLPFKSLPDFFSPTGTLKLINDINDEHVVMCLDTGHFNLFPEEKIYDFLIKGNKKVQCLHIHDNDGKTDLHRPPYTGTFDWNNFIKGLRDIGFKGVLSLETFISPDEGANYERLNIELINAIKEIRNKISC